MARTQRAVKYLNEAVREAGDPSVPEICRWAKKAGYKLAVTTARDILSGKSESPDIGSLEALAAALKKPSLELISKYLKDEPESPVTFDDSDLADLWKLYQAAIAAGKRDEVEGSIKFLKNALKGLK